MADSVRGCPFCELNATDVVAASEFAVAFRDLYPVAEHHSLVIPRRHVASLFELDDGEQDPETVSHAGDHGKVVVR